MISEHLNMTVSDHEIFVKNLVNQTLKICIDICMQKVTRPSGRNGQYEGYGPAVTDKTGTECAAEISALIAK